MPLRPFPGTRWIHQRRRGSRVPHRPDPSSWPDDRLTTASLGHRTVLLHLVGRVLHRPDPSSGPDDRLTTAWLGHATVLLNLFGRWILTDPALRRRVGVHFGLRNIGPVWLLSAALLPRAIPL